MQPVPFTNAPGNQFPWQQGNNPLQNLLQNFGQQIAPQNQLRGPTVHMHQVMAGRSPQPNPPDNQLPRQQGNNPMQFTQQNDGPLSQFHKPSVFQGRPVHMPKIPPYPDFVGPYPSPLQPRVPYPLSRRLHGNQQTWISRPPQRMVANQGYFQGEFWGPTQNSSKSSKDASVSTTSRYFRNKRSQRHLCFKTMQEKCFEKFHKEVFTNRKWFC